MVVKLSFREKSPYQAPYTNIVQIQDSHLVAFLGITMMYQRGDDVIYQIAPRITSNATTTL